MPRRPPAPPPAKKQAFPFVFDLLHPLEPTTRPMFGCTAVYLGPKMILILRDKGSDDPDTGVWVATTHDPESLRELFPNSRPVQVIGNSKGWFILPADAPDFEQSVETACRLIHEDDPRIGKVPKSRQPKEAAKKPAAKRQV